MINPEVLEGSSQYSKAFSEAKPFRHLVIDDFFNVEFCGRMLAEFPSFEDRYALNEMGQVGGKAVRTVVQDLGGAYSELDRYIQTSEFLGFISEITGIPDLIYDPDYVGGGTHENRNGQGLDQHVDFNFHPGTRWHRRLNLIIYLNPEWEESWGGVLELQADPWSGNTSGPRIAPLFNRAVVFETTEKSWHGFSPIHLPPDKQSLSRKSFAIYLYTKDRPLDETAASHATVYVPEGMPESVRAGVALSELQATDLRNRFDRLRDQLKFLYERETNFSTQINALQGALSEMAKAIRVPLQGYAKFPNAPTGYWPDGWVASNFSMTFEPQRPVRSIEMNIWVPENLESEQVLDVEVNGQRWQHFVARGSRSTLNLAIKAKPAQVLEVRISAQRSFVPAKVSASQDDRNLAWKLISAELTH